MKYYQLIPRLTKIIGLETFVFASFIGICALINAVIVGIPNEPNPVGIAFLKVGISLLLVGIWLFVWFYLTKRIMKSKVKPTKEK
ncbi:MAG: hypothetical protein KAS63_07070 [Candidatus Heimdallarchaeota archaeon]|nr:hypothetical protein [Candidatus Heimdallarchaeota archaeon]MCK4955107.1 hypothetical protein [Candidatus Heimdallarchaeota archaeon]